MKILIDLSMLRHPYCGLGQVAINYAKHFMESTALQEAGHEVTLLVPSNLVGHFGDRVKYLPAYRIFRLLPWLMPHFDVWHSIHQLSPYRPVGKSTKRILTIHDLNFIHEKPPSKQPKYMRRLKREVRSSALLCFISNFAKEETLANIDTGNKPLHVIYNGVENFREGAQIPPDGIDDSRPFFLSIGVVKAKKNLHTLLPMMDSFPDYRLIIAGDDSSSYAKTLRSQLDKHSNVSIIGTVTNEQRRWLFAHCSALLFPSLLEGFGLPVIEAMQWGKPVCCSTSSCLPEIGGVHAYYFPDFTPDGMASTVKKALTLFVDENALNEQAYASTFSYSRHFKEYESIYLSLGNKKN